MGMEHYKPIIVMIGCQFIYAGVTLSGRAALLEELSSRVFVVYRQATAFLLIAPVAYFNNSRKGNRACCLGWKNLWLISLLSFVGVTVNQNIYFEGLFLASSSTASALANLVPAITFLMAYSMGLEKIHIRNLRSLAKISGTLVCVGGAVAMALCKGQKLLNSMEFQPTAYSSIIFRQQQVVHYDTWLLGCLFLFGSACCWSLWLILQAHVTCSYPDHLSLTAWMCLIATVQSGIVTVILEPNTNSWKLKSLIQVFACLYAGLSSALTFFAQAWCISRRGPLFSALFNPLCTVIVTVFACIFLHEELYTGTLTGALAVIMGLYFVLWGKAKDYEDTNEEIIENPLKKQNDEITVMDNKDCSINLEEPLLSEKPEN